MIMDGVTTQVAMPSDDAVWATQVAMPTMPTMPGVMRCG